MPSRAKLWHPYCTYWCLLSSNFRSILIHCTVILNSKLSRASISDTNCQSCNYSYTLTAFVWNTSNAWNTDTFLSHDINNTLNARPFQSCNISTASNTVVFLSRNFSNIRYNSLSYASITQKLEIHFRGSKVGNMFSW